jgi:hypothetical protein
MATAGVGSLTPQQAADRAERWFGARVDHRTTGKIKIYPKDPDQPLVVISDRWGSGSIRMNEIKRLQRAGLDVVNGQTPPGSLIKADGRSVDPHLSQKIELPGPPERTEPAVSTPKPSPANMTPRPSTNGAVNGVKQPPFRGTDEPVTRTDYDAVVGMLAEAEQRDQARRAELVELRRLVDGQAKVIERLDLAAQQNRASMARLHKRLGETVDRVEKMAAASSPVDEAEAERQEFLGRAIDLLAKSGMQLTSGTIAANLGAVGRGNTLGKMLAAAARDGRVKVVKINSQLHYFAEPKAD